jgi:16S rRNA (guanine(527)-N(7))-methyltransferase RsmG
MVSALAQEESSDLLSRVSKSLGLGPPPANQRNQLFVFCRLFLRWNSRINLASVETVEGLIERHIVDSLAASRFVVDGDAIVDVGSGGGLPAIPLAILRPGVSVVLHEPRAKRMAFLRTAIRELGLKARVSVSGSRVEYPFSTPKLPGQAESPFSVAMSRATFAPEDWLVLGRQLVEARGRVLVFTTPEGAAPLPAPDALLDYAPNRRLCIFGPSGA